MIEIGEVYYDTVSKTTKNIFRSVEQEIKQTSRDIDRFMRSQFFKEIAAAFAMGTFLIVTAPLVMVLGALEALLDHIRRVRVPFDFDKATIRMRKR